MRPKSYIGVSGIMNAGECDAILRELTERYPCVDRSRIAFGVLTSAKTVHGIANKYPNRYPKAEAIQDIFACNYNNSLYMLHYSADDDRDLLKDLDIAINGLVAYPKQCNGIQINMKNRGSSVLSPSPDKVRTIAGWWPWMRVIVQVDPMIALYHLRDAVARIGQYAYAATMC